MKNSMSISLSNGFLIQVESLLKDFLLRADDDKKKQKRPGVTNYDPEIKTSDSIPVVDWRPEGGNDKPKRPGVTNVRIRKKTAGLNNTYEYSYIVSIAPEGYDGSCEIKLSHNNHPEPPKNIGSFELNGNNLVIEFPVIILPEDSAIYNINEPCVDKLYPFKVTVVANGESMTVTKDVMFTYELETLSVIQKLKRFFRGLFSKK